MAPRSHPAFRKRGTLSQKVYDETCDCQNPDVDDSTGARGVSMGCAVHNDLSEADKRTQQWLRDLELE